MSKKASGSKSVPSAEQVRDNQRRSRARHKEFVDDLKRRIQEYERNGVEVTKEIQQTARKVHADNIKLRALLALKGVPEAEINTFLVGAGPETLNSPLPPGRALPSPNQVQSASVGSQQIPQIRPAPDNRQSLDHILLPPETVQDNEGSERLGHGSEPHPDLSLAQLRYSSSEFSRHSDSPSEMSYDPQVASPEIHVGPATPVSLSSNTCPPVTTLTNDKQLVRSAFETSCEDAASIIAGMRGHTNNEQVREELGCKGQRSCQIKNTTLFQVMDRP